MKKLYFGSNLKMYKDIRSTVAYLTELENLTKDLDRNEITMFIIPSYTTLESASSAVDHSSIMIGAQNIAWEEKGQFTGEISPLMLQEVGMDLVMIGHSERRHVFHETDEEENKKVLCALRHDFTTLLCIGETAEEKQYGLTVETLRRQLKIGLFETPNELLKNLWIAYEPVWSIGVNGTPASAEYAASVHSEIKKCLAELFGKDAAQIPVLYGGSVNPSNAEQLICSKDIDGLFVGRAAWNATDFNQLIRNSISTYKQQKHE